MIWRQGQKIASKNMILELWGQLRREMKGSRSVQKCIFANQDYQIQFHVQIKNTLDLEFERIQEEQQMMALRRVKSEQLRTSQSSNKNKSHSNVNQLLSAPYRSLPQLQEENSTKQAIQPQNEAIPVQKNALDDENLNATVKIVNPQAIASKASKFEARTIKRNSEELSQYMMVIPTKQFSLLSHIIEMSHDGSSSYRPDKSSSNGNRITVRKDNADFIVENKVESLNRFKTLPYEGHHRLEVGDEFRRAQTAQKSEIEQIQESYLSANQQPKTASQGKIKPLLQRYSTKWKFIGLLVILFGVGTILWTGGKLSHKKTKRKSPN